MKRLVAQFAVVVTALALAVPASADDGIIAKQIIGKLKQHKQASSLKGFDLGVQVDKGTVTMMGQVASSDQAMLALDVARRVPGVKLVVNDLYVTQAKQPTVTQLAARQPVAAPQPAAIQPTAIRAVAQQPTPAMQMAPRTAVQPVVAQQPLPSVPQYNATGAVGSAVAYQPQAPQRPVAFAQSTIRQTSGVRPADYVVDSIGGLAGGGLGGGGLGGGAGYGEIAGPPVGGGYDAGGYGGAIGGDPQLPAHSWPSYASSPNYGAVTYPQQYSATAWPYIGPFYPYPQVPLGWRKVSLEWDDGWWFLDFTKK